MKVLKVPVTNYKIIAMEQQPQILINNTIWIKGVEKPYSIIPNDFDFEKLLEGIYYIVYNYNGSLQFDAYADSEVKFNPLYVFIKENGLINIIESYIYQQGLWSKLSETRVFGNGYLNTSDGTISSDKILLNEVGYSNGNKIIGAIPKKEAEIFIPKATDQIIQPGQYLNGPQTIKGDSNLIPSNIAKGLSIFGVGGSRGGCAFGYEYKGADHYFGADTWWNTTAVLSMNLGFTPSFVMATVEATCVLTSTYWSKGFITMFSSWGSSQSLNITNGSTYLYIYVNPLSFDRNNLVVSINTSTNTKGSTRCASIRNIYWFAME